MRLQIFIAKPVCQSGRIFKFIIHVANLLINPVEHLQIIGIVITRVHVFKKHTVIIETGAANILYSQAGIRTP